MDIHGVFYLYRIYSTWKLHEIHRKGTWLCMLQIPRLLDDAWNDMSRIRTDDHQVNKMMYRDKRYLDRKMAETLEMYTIKECAKQFIIILDSFWVIDSTLCTKSLYLLVNLVIVWKKIHIFQPPTSLRCDAGRRQWWPALHWWNHARSGRVFCMVGESTVTFRGVKTGCTHKMMWILMGMGTVLIDMLLFEFSKASKNTWEFSKTSFFCFSMLQDLLFRLL